MSFGISYTHTMKGERYVYYQRLESDGYLNIYNSAKNSLQYRAVDEGGNTAKIAAYFRELRDGEFYKEKNVLQKFFGQEINSTFDTNSNSNYNECGRELIVAFNKVLQLKDIFERNYKLLTETKGQKQLITFFIKYFNEEWEAAAPIFNDQIEKNSINLSTEVGKELLSNHLNTVVERTITRMFTETQMENGIKNKTGDSKDRLTKAYQELNSAIKDLSTNAGNIFIHSIIKELNLEKLANEYFTTTETYSTSKFFQKDSKKSFERLMHTTGGQMSETLGTFIVNYLQSSLQEGGSMSAIQTGGTKIKADFMITATLSENVIQDWLKDIEGNTGTRPKDILAINKLENRLSKLNEDMLIYVNAKNYSVGNYYFNKNGGFGAGSAISLETWDTMMHTVNKKGRDLIFLAMQLIPGAIGENKKEQISNAFARAVSSALFDDFTLVGDKESAPNHIHLLYLNGIYTPLSFYFDLLQRAFSEYSQEEVKKYIAVDINTPEAIMFGPDSKSWSEIRNEWYDKNSESMWRAQQQQALKEITISYHFMQNFQEEMKKLQLF